VQEIDEFSNTLCGFRVLEDHTSGGLAVVDGPLAKIGGQIVYVFVAESGRPHAGTLDTLKPIMEVFIDRCPHQIAVILQIRELIGTDQEKKVARASMRKNISRTAGTSAAYAFYEGATLRSALWGHVLATAANAEAAQRILRVRPKLSAHIEADGVIKLDLSALDVHDLSRINQDALAAELSAEFDFTPVELMSAQLHLDIKPSNVIQTGRVSGLLKKISLTGRQEERIAILADAILQDRETGVSVLIQYKQDRAKFANWALHELRTSLLYNQTRSSSFDEEVIANLIPRFFTQYYPLSRGQLLLHLAKHLAKWPKINGAIRRSLEKTHSIFVDSYRKEIEQMLAEAEHGP